MPAEDRRPGEDAIFFTVSDAGFFEGTVALLNSLRLTGHSNELVVLDCGFSEPQASLLRPFCTLIPFDRSRAATPASFKAFPSLLGASGVVVILDSDVIVTHSLNQVLEDAQGGRICAVADSSPDRWFSDWERLFQLPAAPRNQVYVNAGFLAFSATAWPELLPRWWSACQLVWSRRFVRGIRIDPLQFPDQDALNGLLMSVIPPEALHVLPRESGPFGALLSRARVGDLRSLSCSCGGRTTLFVHNSGGGKPWDRRLRSAWMKWRPAYVHLLRRALAWPDVPVRVPSPDLPLWLRPGAAGAVLEWTMSKAAMLRHRTRGVRRGPLVGRGRQGSTVSA